jgi:hypothetical protein
LWGPRDNGVKGSAYHEFIKDYEVHACACCYLRNWAPQPTAAAAAAATAKLLLLLPHNSSCCCHCHATTAAAATATLLSPLLPHCCRCCCHCHTTTTAAATLLPLLPLTPFGVAESNSGGFAAQNERKRAQRACKRSETSDAGC